MFPSHDRGASFIQATGGTESTSGNFKIHTFTGSADFTVSAVGNAAGGGDKVSYIVVAGGACIKDAPICVVASSFISCQPFVPST